MNITPTPEWLARFDQVVAQLGPYQIPRHLHAARREDPHGPRFVLGMLRETDITTRMLRDEISEGG